MAIALVASVTAAPGSGSGTTAAIDTTGATLLVISVSYYVTTTDITVVSDSKGNTWTPLAIHGAGTSRHRFFYSLASSVGAGHTVTVTASGNYTAILVYAFSEVGSYQTESGVNAASSPGACGSLTPSANGALILTGIVHSNASTDTITTAGFTVATVPYVGGATMQGSAGYAVQATAAAINPTWSWTGGSVDPLSAAVFLPAAGPAPVTGTGMITVGGPALAGTGPPGPSVALGRVQTTPQATISSATTIAVTFGAAPGLGHGIVLVLLANGVFASCTDNHGHTYTLARRDTGPSAGRVNEVWFCPAATATGTPFTITATAASVRAALAVALEVNGAITVNQSAGGETATVGGSSAGPTPAITADDVVVVAGVSVGSSVAGTLTVGGDTPAWRQEAEAIGGLSAGEVDSRIVGSATGTTQAVTWTWSGAAYAAATIVVFAGTTVPPPETGTPLILIESIDRTPRVRATFSLDVTYTLGSRAVARFETVDASTDSTVEAYHPDVEETVEMWHGGTKLFAGMLLGQDVRALGDPSVGVVAALTAADYAMALERRLVTHDYRVADGWTLKTVVQHLVTTYLAGHGITLDPAMATGPALTADLHYDGVTMQAALTDLATMSGWIFRLTPFKVLEMFAVGTKVAPFDLSTSGGAILGGVSWRKSRSSYVNRVVVRIGGNNRLQVPVTWIGDDLTMVFPLDFPVALKEDLTPDPPEYRVWVVDAQPIVVEQPGDLYYPIYAAVEVGGPINWDFDIPGNAMLRWEPLPIGTTATWWYWAQFPYDVIVEDAADIAIRGVWEERIERADIFTIAEATAIGEGILAQRGPGGTPRVVSIRTRNQPAFPGDVIPLDVPERELTGDWLITQTRISQWSNDTLQYDYECLEGGVAHVSWIDYLRNLWGTRIASPPAQPEVPALGRRRPRVGTRRRS